MSPQFASSVILYRFKEKNNLTPSLNSQNFEVCLIQRSKSLKFLGGFHAFPGGKLDPLDCSESNLIRCKGLERATAHKLILDKQTSHQDPRLSLSFWITAIRELFEEVGILLAYNSKGKIVEFSNPAVHTKFALYRTQLLLKKLTIFEIMQRENLYYAVDRLYYFQHFITPDFSPIRYDARFFLAALPPHQMAEPAASEIAALEWGEPSTLLKRYQKKEIKLIPPQYACLNKLRKITDIEAFCSSLQ
ncbi:MAG: NUDIX hydrolase [Candidatus Helarchaeota archaeon]